MENLYIHVPFCDGKCAYCGFYSLPADASFCVRYAEAPARELAAFLVSPPAAGSLPFSPRTVYIGGGSPSALGVENLRRMMLKIAGLISLDSVEEYTVEVNPSQGTPDFFQSLRGMGVTRISIGAQSFNDSTLQRIGRRHSAAQILSSVRNARLAGFQDVGIDLIAGLPGVSSEEWDQTLQKTVELQLPHVSVYALTIEQGTPLAAWMAAGKWPFPDDGELLDAVTAAEQMLASDGLVRYEISNYAKPGFSCRHNLSVWRGADYLGLGPAASSRIGRFRWTSDRDLEEYLAAVFANHPSPRTSEILSAEDDALERVIFKFRLLEGVDMTHDLRENPFLSSRAAHWEKTLSALSRRGICCRTDSGWTLTSRGREVCDAVLRDLE